MNNTTATALSLRDPWSLVPPVGNLDAYIAAVNRIPLLTPQEEVSYAERLQSQGDVEAAGSCRTCVWWCRCRGSTWATACRKAT
jgi:RNA polymerase sigma-32 factor